MLSWCCGKIPSLGRGVASLLLLLDIETAKPAKNRWAHARHLPWPIVEADISSNFGNLKSGTTSMAC
jgi:hypothetical protein